MKYVFYVHVITTRSASCHVFFFSVYIIATRTILHYDTAVYFEVSPSMYRAQINVATCYCPVLPNKEHHMLAINITKSIKYDMLPYTKTRTKAQFFSSISQSLPKAGVVVVMVPDVITINRLPSENVPCLNYCPIC